ncbi:glycosyltransferase family 1 protein [Mucilaginibacter limnophilus]|uniref:Glycosyltransferase family 1 protein n=1 Tax=Mucilaginibacter limnophilus TaxID=1932778 RepID=A0A437MVX9_9SPHI|nr:glycosyltransferase family 1 protein [Mucilaginibacter limnophilus]RVU01808.1 glycosyltransferase family 1 protein [Mucilaginibacter limnophilus]
MEKVKKRILLTFDSMRYPNTGLFYFGKSLGNSILAEDNSRFDITFYVHRKSIYQFANRVKIQYLSKLHKLFFPQSGKYNLVHFTDQYPRLRPQKVKGKKILTVHDINFIYENFPPEKVEKKLNKLTRYVNLCDKIVAISNYVAEDIIKYIPSAQGKVQVIYNGADKLSIKADHQPAYQPQRPFIFTIGHISAKKNFAVLPALLHNNDYELVIAGIETPYKDEIMHEAKKWGCEDRVKITGPISDDDKAWYYKNCLAFAFPSIAEGFGLPVIEAMHFGKPVFLSTHTSLPEIGGDAAFYFDSFDGKAMQKVFAEGMEKYNSTDNIEAHITAYAEKFSWQNTAKQYLSLYEECLED